MGAGAKLVLVLVDTLLGYATVWRTARRRGIVVVERGWFDMSVDPVRYRIPSSLQFLTRRLGALVPRADYAVILSGDPCAIHNRKPEIGVDEIERQVDRWRALAPRVGRHAIELDGVDVPAATQAKRLFNELREKGSAPDWRRVPLGPRRFDLHVAGRVSSQAWIHRSYRRLPRLADPLRPALALVARRDPLPELPASAVHELCRQTALTPHGMLAMRSSTPGRWIVGLDVDGELAAVAKIGPKSDDRLRKEAEILCALAPERELLGIPEVLWSGESEDNFIVVSGALVTRKQVRASITDISAFCTALVRGGPERRPLTHGDLAPWNAYRCGGRLQVFDWEYAVWERLPLYDLAHYVIQSGALLRRHTPIEVVALLTARHSPGWQHLEACEVHPQSASELLVQYLEVAPEFARKSLTFRTEVLACLR
jgi:hypothetical protein